MNKLFILGVSLSFALSAGTAIAADEQATTFQTLSQIQSITPMTGEELDAVEGRSLNIRRSFRNFNDFIVNIVNESTVRQRNRIGDDVRASRGGDNDDLQRNRARVRQRISNVRVFSNN